MEKSLVVSTLSGTDSHSKITFLSSFHQHPTVDGFFANFSLATNFSCLTREREKNPPKIVAKKAWQPKMNVHDGETERECFVWQATIKFIWNMWNVKCILMRHKFFSSPLSLLAASLLSLLLFFSSLFFCCAQSINSTDCFRG